LLVVVFFLVLFSHESVVKVSRRSGGVFSSLLPLFFFVSLSVVVFWSVVFFVHFFLFFLFFSCLSVKKILHTLNVLKVTVGASLHFFYKNFSRRASKAQRLLSRRRRRRFFGGEVVVFCPRNDHLTTR
jgi:hypothetical protein